MSALSADGAPPANRLDRRKARTRQALLDAPRAVAHLRLLDPESR